MRLVRAATPFSADLFLAHTLQALPAAAQIATDKRSLLGFDAEDYHRGEIPDHESTIPHRKLVQNVEERFIPRCHYVSAASDGIGSEYAKVLGISKPLTILNVFPLAERAFVLDPDAIACERNRVPLSLYWFSQMIGPDRGIEDVLAALPKTNPMVHLHVRGNWAAGYEQHFRNACKRLQVTDRVHIHSPAPPHELIARARCHDVGLALEPGDRRNNAIAASNKLFCYMLAGLPIVATNVPGQRTIIENITGAASCYTPGDVHGLLRALNVWVTDTRALAIGKAASAAAAHEKYCWDKEKMRLVSALERLFDEQSQRVLMRGCFIERR